LPVCPFASRGLGSQRWFKLQRAGDTFTTFVSSGGATWTTANTRPQRNIGAGLYVGLFTYAASSQNPNVFWASFDHVSLSTTPDAAPGPLPPASATDAPDK
jgi:hypothetical protein